MTTKTVNTRILVVDDEPAVRVLLIEVLTSDGVEIVAAVDGEDGLRQALLAPFDLCVLDVEMPKLNGYETCLRLRELPFTRELPVLFLTAHTDKESIDKTFSVGGSDYLGKPIHPILLRQRVHNLLTLARLARQKDAVAEALNFTPYGAPPQHPRRADRK